MQILFPASQLENHVYMYAECFTVKGCFSFHISQNISNSNFLKSLNLYELEVPNYPKGALQMLLFGMDEEKKM